MNLTTSHHLYHVDLEVDGQAYVVGHIILSHIHYVVQLVRHFLLHAVLISCRHIAP